MSILRDTKEDSYRAQRQASQGAGITLVYGCGVFIATMDCAKRVATILGDRELQDAGDGIIESIPVYKIPLEEISSALQKLTTRFSVALVDIDVGKNNTRFVLVWKIPAASTNGSKPEPASTNIDDY